MLPIFHRNIPPLFPNHSTMALTKTLKPSKTTSSIIKTRSQSRTGTTVRTNERTTNVAPAPVVTTNDPVPVTDDLFAGRPKTGTLKDPPPVPTPRNSDSDSGAKKPAAKPKGRPKKIAPKATRKPRKSRAFAVDANELVNPMANMHPCW